VAKVLAADDSQWIGLFAELESRLQNFPREPAAALAVETILRRKVGPTELRDQLLATSTALAEQTSGTLRMYLDSIVRAEQSRALQDLVGNREFHVAGTLLDGTTFDSQSLTGKVVVVVFWAPESAKCLAELPRLVKLHQLHSKRLEIVAVTSVRGARKVQEFLDRHPEVTWPQLVDADAAQQGALHPLAKEAGVATLPTFFVVDDQGVLRSINAGSDLESLTASLLGGQ
jgi:thiol-disulfide isomerase/thioredoxin